MRPGLLRHALGVRCILFIALLACDSESTSTLADEDQGRVVDASFERADADASAPGARLLHVGLGGEPADGTRDRPFPDLVTAYAGARSGDVVFLLPGEHGPALAPPEGVELIGSGVGVSTLTGVLRLEGEGRLGGFTLKGPLQVAGPWRVSELMVEDVDGVCVEVTASAHFEQVAVQRCAAEGLRASATLNWLGGRVEQTGGIGVRVEGARLEASDLTVVEAGAAGIRLIDSTAALGNIRVQDTVYIEAEGTGSGVGVLGGEAEIEGLQVSGGDRALRTARGAQVSVGGLVVQGAAEGVGVVDEAQVTLMEPQILETRNGGIAVGRGAAATIEGGRIAGVGRFGVLVSQGLLTALDLHIDGSTNRGISILRSEATLARVRIDAAGEVGIQITDASGPVHIQDTELRRCSSTGIAVNGGGEHELVLQDVLIEETQRGADQLADGLHIFDGHATVRGLTSRGNGGAGVLVEQASISLSDSMLEDNGGPGLVVAAPSITPVVRGTTARNNGGAGFAIISGRANLSDCRASENRVQAGEGAGDGVAVVLQGGLVATGLTLDGNAGSGLAITNFSSAELGASTLRANQRNGVFVQCGGSRLEESSENTYEDNAEGPRNSCD